LIHLLLLLVSFTLTYFIKNYYIKNALLEEVNERSSHTVPTPHGGGIAIALTWFVGIIISVVSFFDDIYELSAKLRM
jgi:Fuc2NAc and GlcNAc transferase